MSGGGSKNKPETKGKLNYPGAPTAMSIPQAMPGQLEAIAQQMSAGFGSTPAANMGQMDALYSPMNLMRFSEPISTTTERYAAGKGAYNPLNTGNLTLDEILMGKKPGELTKPMLPGKPSTPSTPSTPGGRGKKTGLEGIRDRLQNPEWGR